MAEKRNVLLVTTANMASNPRCLKEVKALLSEGYDVSIVKFRFSNWTKEPEQLIEQELQGVNWIEFDISDRSSFLWVRSTIVQQFSKRLSKFIKGSVKLLSYAFDKRVFILHRMLESRVSHADIVIAHNPGAFWPAYEYARKKRIPFGIDVEDYHPGETNNENDAAQMKTIMRGILPEANYISAASPLILKNTLTEIGSYSGRSEVIENVFSIEGQPVFDNNLDYNNSLKLFWFSQVVGLDRGIQDVVMAMNKIVDFPILVTILGSCDDKVKNSLNSLLSSDKHKIVFRKNVSQSDLFKEAARHHIGLALEANSNFNRNICLTNKIYTYLLCGNAIVASGTDAQSRFMDENPDVGVVYPIGDSDALASLLKGLHSSPKEISKMRAAAYKKAQERYCWEKEQHKFLSLVNRALD